MTGWAVTIRDAALKERWPASDYTRLSMDLRLMASGGTASTCELTLPRGHRSQTGLVTPGAGIVVRAISDTGGVLPLVEFSGQIVHLEIDDTPGGRSIATAESDDTVLMEELAFPVTSTDVSATATSTFGSASDVRTGPAETVFLAFVAANIGPTAGVARRRYPWLVIPASAGRGSVITQSGRMDTLHDLATRILGPAGLAYRIVQSIPGFVEIQVIQPAAVGVARFSAAAGTLSSATLRLTAPRTDEVIVGGDGDGSLRRFTRRTNTSLQAAYARRRVRFADQSGTTDLGEMRASADEQLASDTVTAGVTFTAVDRPGLRYGLDYRLGDIVTAAVAGQTVTDTITAVTVDHEQNSSPQVTPTLGAPGADESPTQVDRVQRLISAVVRR